MAETKIIVLDDGPTGSQTVHSCLLLTRWDQDTLRAALLDDSPLFFVLTNTRGMNAARAATVTREVCRNLNLTLTSLAAQGLHFNPIFVSRLDSTLRSHYPVEIDVMSEELGGATGFDAHFLIPAFFEGGRVTRGSTQYLMADGMATPVHQTEFARDSVFGYSTSYLPDYVEEKTAGRIKANQVERFLLAEIRGDVSARLMALHDNVCCVVDAETQADLNYFAVQLKTAAASGKRFLFRSAASLLAALTQLPPQPVAASAIRQFVRNGKPGAVIVGSHVKKTTAQLNKLLKEPDIIAIEVDVDLIATERSALLQKVLHQAALAQATNATSVMVMHWPRLNGVKRKLVINVSSGVSSKITDAGLYTAHRKQFSITHPVMQPKRWSLMVWQIFIFFQSHPGL